MVINVNSKMNQSVGYITAVKEAIECSLDIILSIASRPTLWSNSNEALSWE
jgi:hypothetical protein